MLSLVALLFILFLVILLLFSFKGDRPLPLQPKSKILLITAHPDDEVMFFTPVLRALRLAGHRVFFLCISNGNFEGLGAERAKELCRSVSALGFSASDSTVLDYADFSDGNDWDRDALSRVLLRHMEVLSIDCVISFDRYGVSGHKNHISCFEGLQELYTRGSVPTDVQVFVLDSVPLWRKYIGGFDAPLSVLRSPFRYFAWGRDVVAAWRGMASHKTQFVWFRVLFMIFSRYIYINTLRRIAPQLKVPKMKTKAA